MIGRSRLSLFPDRVTPNLLNTRFILAVKYGAERVKQCFPDADMYVEAAAQVKSIFQDTQRPGIA